jgi:hypothetical protein
MELALNLVWLVLALFGIALLGSELSRCRENGARKPSNQQKIIAMGCALIILFFVVSMTDDLHDQEVVVEESRMLRVAAAAGTGWHSPAAAHSIRADEFRQLFAITHSSFTFDLTLLSWFAEPPVAPYLTAELPCSLHGRAPPACLT